MVWRDPSSVAKLLFSGTRDGERGGERGGDPYGERSGERGDERGANALIGVFPKTRVTRSDVVATSDVVAGVAVGAASRAAAAGPQMEPPLLRAAARRTQSYQLSMKRKMNPQVRLARQHQLQQVLHRLQELLLQKSRG